MRKKTDMEPRSGRTTLRIPPELHDDLVAVAETLGLDLNGLLTMMIREGFPAVKARAVAIELRSLRDPTATTRKLLFERWQQEKPGGTVEQYIEANTVYTQMFVPTLGSFVTPMEQHNEKTPRTK